MMKLRVYAIVICCGTISISAQDKVTFEAHIRPILKTHCFYCHGEGDERKAGLDLRLARLARSGGKSGPAILPGNPAESRLFQKISSREMPPGDDKHLTSTQIDLFRRWIAQGAVTARPEPESADTGPFFTDEERQWWAFRAIESPQIPALGAVKSSVRSPVDAFILAQMSALESGEKSLGFSNLADRVTLFRRASLVIRGIPPTIGEIDRFVQDPSTNAWDRAIDELMNSPQYGERWARHWLDVAGYADSEGYTDEDTVRKHAYRYRDYVIQSFNEDTPFDQFVIEQLAGDELAGWPGKELSAETQRVLTATGFLRMAPDGTASSAANNDLGRNQVVADTIQIVATSLLGLTVHCAQCHDHRYDPIPQSDYYRIRAVFEPALNWKKWKTPGGRQISLYSEEDRAERARIEAEAQKVDATRKEKIAFYIAKTLTHELLMTDPDVRSTLRAAFEAPADKRTKEQTDLLAQFPTISRITAGSLYLYDRRRDARAKDLDAKRLELTKQIVQDIRQRALADLPDDQRNELNAALAESPEKRSEHQRQLITDHPALNATPDTIAMFDSEGAKRLEEYETAAKEIRAFRIQTELTKLTDQAKAVREEIPNENFIRALTETPKELPTTHVFHRGDHQQPREAVEPGELSILSAGVVLSSDSTSTSGRRLAFARHITNKDHPLLARVIANRIWLHIFGRAIVGTPGDFGVLGDAPTHPLLLDWLASELIQSGWSVKHIHRLILTSTTFMQSAVSSEHALELDPENNYYSRWRLRRLEAETMRDSILQVTGIMHRKMYGAAVPVMEDDVGQIVLGVENLDGERKPTKPIALGAEAFRRSLYVQVRRSRPLGVLENFDLPETAPNCTTRSSSNVAPQALMLMNGKFVAEMASHYAARLIRERPGDDRAQLELAWMSAFTQRPASSQLTVAESFLNQQRSALREALPKASAEDLHRLALASYCQALIGSNKFLYIE